MRGERSERASAASDVSGAMEVQPHGANCRIMVSVRNGFYILACVMFFILCKFESCALDASSLNALPVLC